MNTTESLEHELMRLETAYWQAMKDGDADAATRLSDEPSLVTGASGVMQISRSQLARMLETATWKLRDFASPTRTCAASTMMSRSSHTRSSRTSSSTITQ